MSNPKEGYAFVNESIYKNYAEQEWPNALPVGEYKVLTFARIDEPNLIEFAVSSGLTYKSIGAEETINSMNKSESGPFVVYDQDVHTVINHFNPAKEV